METHLVVFRSRDALNSAEVFFSFFHVLSSDYSQILTNIMLIV